MKASVLDLRRRMKEVLRALDRNEPVTLFHRGREKGVIMPAGVRKRAKVPVREHPAFGMWKDRKDLEDVPGAVDAVRKGRGHAV